MKEIESNPDTLSSKEYWNKVLEGAKLPRFNLYRHYYITMNFIDVVLKNEHKKTFLEIGAGSSGWLPYFAQKYGYIVSGLDYSDIGCKLAEENLKLLNIQYDEIICNDIFNWNTSKKYDVIFSYGVIEHFENPKRVLEICNEHLAENGIIISLVPNLSGLMGFFSKYFVPEIHKIHKIITKKEMIRIHKGAGFYNIRTNYAGIFSLSVIPWINSRHWLFKENSFRRRSMLQFIRICEGAFSLLFRFVKFDFSSKIFSPYVIAIMKKCD